MSERMWESLERYAACLRGLGIRQVRATDLAMLALVEWLFLAAVWFVAS